MKANCFFLKSRGILLILSVSVFSISGFDVAAQAGNPAMILPEPQASLALPPGATVPDWLFAANGQAAAIAAGGEHTCALTASGGVKCWGINWYGEVGDGTTIDRNTPVDVSGLTSGVIAIAAGRWHACALTASGGVKCWGANNNSQLGDDTNIDRYTPVDVIDLSSGVSAISAGGYHTCALMDSGEVKCWGHNLHGQLGNGTFVDSTTPVDVSGLASGVSAISAGDGHTCALTDSGGIKCWGSNDDGELGDGTFIVSNTPVNVSGLSNGVSAIDAGSGHTCALTALGGVKCWGYNSNGELGDGTWDSRNTPVEVSGLSSGVSAISAGSGHTCALETSGGVKCWGFNDWGELGDGTTANQNTPVEVNGLASGVSAIFAGGYHTCARMASGRIKCWGENEYGQLGDGTFGGYNLPKDVIGLSSGPSAITAGYSHTCALTASGGVKCWGRNSYGQLGDDTTTARAIPVEVSGLASGVSAITAGYRHTCALTTSGGVKCWGANSDGQLGDGTNTDRHTPVDVSGLPGEVSAIAAGGYHTCVLMASGGVRCWGANSDGQLGNGSYVDSDTPVSVWIGDDVSAIAAGGSHTCALMDSGGVMCWGDNEFGQLGDGTNTSQNEPDDVEDLSSGVSAIAAGYSHTCALADTGEVKCWGRNRDGQLGDGTTIDQNTPVDVLGLPGEMSAVAAGGSHTCALTQASGIMCWGDNLAGQLGDGTFNGSTTPVEVSGLSSGVGAVAAGGSHTCALATSGGVKCWGYNGFGQIGNGIAMILPHWVVGFDGPPNKIYLPAIVK
jgi:alpha-tubulin suppressor-like RCC1 family protein